MKVLRALYLIIANTVILLVVVLVVTHSAVKTLDQFQHASGYYKYRTLPEAARRNYSHMTPEDVEELLLFTGTMRYRYAPWVGYREDVTKSRFVNVDAYGIRANGKTPRDISAIEGAIWFFGGSTTFGYGVADGETIPAQLEKLMGRPVVNFGVGNFYSAQENLLLNQYVRIGYRPSVAIFLDGINEGCDIEDYQAEMRLIFAKTQKGYGWGLDEIGKPVTYAYDAISRKLDGLTGRGAGKIKAQDLNCEGNGKRNALRTLHARILAERESLCRLYGIECRTFVQPFAGVHGRQDDMNFPEVERKEMRELFSHLEANWRKAGALFVTDALDGHDRHAFIDNEHYSAAASELIARAIAVHIGAGRK